MFEELNEIFAEISFGIKRLRAKGADGKTDNKFVEIKTITPEKKKPAVSIKRAGNFSKLVVIKNNNKFNFEGRIIDRKSLSKGTGELATISWKSMKT